MCHQRNSIKNLGGKLIQFRGIVGEGRTRTSGGGGRRIKRVAGGANRARRPVRQ